MWFEEEIYQMVSPRHPTNMGVNDALDFIDKFVTRENLLEEPSHFSFGWSPPLHGLAETYSLEMGWNIHVDFEDHHIDLQITIDVEEESFIWNMNRSAEGGTMNLEVELEMPLP